MTGQPDLGQAGVARATAPVLPTAASLAGAITEHVLDSTALGAPHAVTVYRPPGQPAPLLGVSWPTGAPHAASPAPWNRPS
jgi:hypothetical protein